MELCEAYCIKPAGSITSLPKYTVSGFLPISVTPATFSAANIAIPTSTSDPGYEFIEPTLLPTAPGTISGCYFYANPMYTSNTCQYLAAGYDVSFDDLLMWNPSLDHNATNCTTTSTNSYCVQRYENSTKPDDDFTYCAPASTTEAGTASDCDRFTTIDTQDIGSMAP
ncbi:uncharacterized protein BO72DRAFT_458560 [Aspergillus fijiensis CBS 313.89]|uniref:LysM domain-containing protein n=1 Tax=Aspergillus fijiensis CBS 313.89 TaxID=1448319 RepID=A0A8G1VZL8_9EURO|nr:uncharacterized protein BO72DRAFT_458560 [Aspergillus fijiensis CBS 313.89]RAK77658.1 hypothetical protein BO72DRAFT_458560 [Aspergillus fijiensis CBS 313.89]